MGLHRSAVLPTRPMIFAALVAHLRIIHRIQAADRARPSLQSTGPINVQYMRVDRVGLIPLPLPKRAIEFPG